MNDQTMTTVEACQVCHANERLVRCTRCGKKICSGCGEVVGNDSIHCATCQASPTGHGRLLGVAFSLIWTMAAVAIDRNFHNGGFAMIGGGAFAFLVSMIVVGLAGRSAR
jgi:hypothetical protein